MTKKHMDQAKFLNKFSLISEYFKWETNGEIRGYKHNKRFCPITAVAYVLKETSYELTQWQEAAQILNMPTEIAQAIANAADQVDAESLDLYNLLLERIP